MVHDSAGCGPSFRSMWAAIPFHVVQDSAKWSTIPVITKMRTASQRNPGPLPVESPDRFPWNHRTTSTGIRTQLQCQSFRRRSARWNSPQAQCQRMCSRRLGSSHVSFSNPMAVGFLSRKSAANERQSKTCTNLRSMAEKSVTRI
jgi:hypothetical protein